MSELKSIQCEHGFLGFPEAELADFNQCKIVIQQCPYEHTSSYIKGSEFGPKAMIEASHFVEYYDEELGIETYKEAGGICTLEPLNFTGMVDCTGTLLCAHVCLVQYFYQKGFGEHSPRSGWCHFAICGSHSGSCLAIHSHL